MSGGLAAVFAHPDDDTFGIGGTVALLAGSPGFRLGVVLATSGEAGRIADPSLATAETLGRVREAEDRASWEVLGVVPASLEFLRYPDGGLAGVPRQQLVGRLVPFLLGFRPEVVVTFGPDGVTGHPDHVAVGRAATEAFHRARAEVGREGDPRALALLLYVALPRSRLDRLAALLAERGLEPPDPTQPFQPRSVPDEAVAVRVDCTAVWRVKLEALRAHRTQAEVEALPDDLWPFLLGAEHFVQAWPEREAGAPVLTGLFQGPG